MASFDIWILKTFPYTVLDYFTDFIRAHKNLYQRSSNNAGQFQIFADHNNMALFETSAKADSEADHVESIFLTLLHKLQQSKPMHVQSADEREAKVGHFGDYFGKGKNMQTQQKLVLKAGEKLEDEEGGMCC